MCADADLLCERLLSFGGLAAPSEGLTSDECHVPTRAVRSILIAWAFVTCAGQHTLRARPLGKVVGLRAVRLSKMGHHRDEQRIDAKKLELGVSRIRVHIGPRALCFGCVRLLEQAFQGY